MFVGHKWPFVTVSYTLSWVQHGYKITYLPGPAQQAGHHNTSLGDDPEHRLRGGQGGGSR
jgi:hypothetical protein